MNEGQYNAEDISVIVPLLNEYENLPKLYEQLRHFSFGQIIFVDGGSDDGSWQWLQKHLKKKSEIEKHTVIQAPAGRAVQMNKGAELAENSLLLFLHADSVLPDHFSYEIVYGLHQHEWGRFDIQFLESDFRMSVIAWFMNCRSRLTSIATGDQGIFIRRETFETIEGFSDIPLMEDVDLSKRLKLISKPYCSRLQVKTSARRWLQKGVLKTVFLMWRFRFLYFLGVSAETLATQYKNVR